ncbi:lactosylceramide 4-alpha-galactosyltransferase [Salvia divinorum]|uniref:Lactosylceramide 4-alpha-galactosyltransferase n=1 Tax=Salvia divinorum TaxID=28513 RepID=A0ABD1G3Z8_SALDI
MLRQLRTRWRPCYGEHICALIAAVLLLLSVSLLYSRLSFFNSQPQVQHPLHHSLDDSFSPLRDDLDSEALATTNPNDDRIEEHDDAVLEEGGSNNDEELLAEEEDEQNQGAASTSSYFFDHVNGVVRRSFNRRSIDEWEDYVPFDLKRRSDLGLSVEGSKPVFGSDDVLVDDKLRTKLSQVRKIEDALLLKRVSVEGRDPDGTGVTGLTRGDKIFLKGLLNEFKRTPFLAKKPLAVSESQEVVVGKRGSEHDKVSRVGRRALTNNNIRIVRRNEGLEREYYADGKMWGYYPGLDERLSFGNFMDAFFRRGRCNMRVFMVWNSPPWMFGIRQQRGLESLLHHHPDACVVVFSETIELNFFNGFVKNGYKVAVVMPNLDELLKDTPTHLFAQLAAIYKYGGIYLDSDIVMLKPLSELDNTVGYEDGLNGKTLNGAVMVFRKHSPFILLCLEEFYASYDDAQLRWNGADLLTRVANQFLSNKGIADVNAELLLQPASVFFPFDSYIISRYFTAPRTEIEKHEQDDLFNKVMHRSVTVHLWNSATSALIPEPGSLVFRLLNQFCIHCTDAL